MKKNLKKTSSIILTFVLVFVLSLTAFAAGIDAEKAKSIALEDSAYSQSDVLCLRASVDYEDGVKVYDVSYLVKQSEGKYLEYEYEISAADGTIREKNVDTEFFTYEPSNEDIGEAKAKAKALEHFGLKESDVKLLKVSVDYENGVKVYEIEFCKELDVKYSCDVVASNGLVIDAETDVSRNVFDKIELFFELLFAMIFVR